MKHCRKEPTEPAGLATYRMANPKATWDDFKDNDRDAVAELTVQLVQDQRGLCAFCELELADTNLQVAHFHPKSDQTTSTNWALMWSNLWLCCKGGTQTWMQAVEEHTPPLPENRSCDENKEGLILDNVILCPADVPPYPRIFQYSQYPNSVEIVADPQGCATAGIEVEIASNTITRLNLNCQRLSTARLTVLKMIEQDVKAARTSGINDLGASNLPAKWLSLRSSGRYRRFFTLIRWRLQDAAEEHLRKAGYQG